MGKYTITKANGSSFDVYDLEQDGPNNISVPRQIKNISLGGGAGFNSFIILDDLTYRFVPGFQFNIIESGANNGTYTVSSASFNGTETTISTVELIPSNGLPFGSIQYSLTNFESDLLLYGKGNINFGKGLNQNFYNLLENFSASTAPANPVTGQLWYNSTNDTLYKYDSLGWSSNVNVNTGTLSFVDPQHPADNVNPILEFKGDDNDVGLSLTNTVDPNSGDSIFRILSSDLSERLRVEFNGYVSTNNAFKSTNTTTLNELNNSLQFPIQKGIVSVNNARMETGSNGNTWQFYSGNPGTDYSLIAHDSTDSLLFGVNTDNDTVEVVKDFVVDSVDNTFYVDSTNNRIGIRKNNPSHELDVNGNVTYSGQLLSPNGTSIKPGISFLNNDSVGFRLVTSNSLAISIGGTDKILVRPSGLLQTSTASYETLLLNDNDIPNKKYVDNLIQSNNELFELNDVNIVSLIDDNILTYDSLSNKWINQSIDDANIVSKNGSTLNSNANITFNGGEVLGLPAFPTDNTAATSKEYVESSYLKKFTNIPVSKIGHLNYLPLDISGSYEGAAIKDQYGWCTAVQELDGSIVGIRVGHNGNFIRLFYFYTLSGNFNDIVNTDFEYRPTFLLQDEYIQSIFGTSSNNTGFFAIIANTSNNNKKKYWIYNNGTMDSEYHTFRDVSTIPTLTDTGWTSIEHINEYNLWIVSSSSHFYVYDDNFNLLNNVNHIDIDNPSHVIYNQSPDGKNKISSNLGYQNGMNIQYYIHSGKIRISLKLGIWVKYDDYEQSYGINLLYDYDIGNNLFNIVYPFPYIIEPTAGPDINYPVTSNFYNFYRDKWIRISDSIIIAAEFPTRGTDYIFYHLNPSLTWNDLVDSFGKTGYSNLTSYIIVPNDASILGKALEEIMYIGQNTILATSYSKFVSENVISKKWSVSNILDNTSTYSLEDGSIALNPPLSTNITSIPQFIDFINLSTVIKSNGAFLTKYYDPSSRTYFSFDASSGIPGPSTIESVLPLNYENQLRNILEGLDPSLITLSYNIRPFHVANNIYVITYGYWDSSTLDGGVGYMTATLNGSIFTSTSSLYVTYTNPSITGLPYSLRPGCAIFEDDINNDVYIMFPSLTMSLLGSSTSTTSVLKITNDGISNGTIENNINNVFYASSQLHNVVGIHPEFGPYNTDSFNFSLSRCKIYYKKSLLSNVIDRMRESFNFYLNNTGITDQLIILTIQSPTGFNIYYSDTPVFLNGTYYTIGAGSIDLSTIFLNPENSIFSLYVQIINNNAQISIFENDVPETNALMKFGEITTNSNGIVSIDVNKSSRFEGYPTSIIPQPLSIPVADAAGKIDPNWIDAINNGQIQSSAKLYFFGFGS